MNSYGLSLQGNFVIEILDVRPEFNESQIGRFIFVESTEQYWIGGLTNWLNFGLSTQIIKLKHIDFGFESEQISAINIPFRDNIYNIIQATNVHDALIELMRGTGLSNNCVTDRIIAERSIHSYHINWGTSIKIDNEGNTIPEFYVGAKNIPIESIFRGVSEITNVQSAINLIEERCPIILRKLIQPTAWDHAPAEDLYRVMIPITPISKMCVIVQCYDLSGRLLIPAKITTDLDVSRIYVWMPNAISLIVIIVG